MLSWSREDGNIGLSDLWKERGIIKKDLASQKNIMSINKLDKRGEDLREACHSGDADKVYALISNGVDINDANKVR